MAKITSRFPRSLKRLKCNASRNYQCGGKCQPLKNNCKKMALGMAKNGLEYLKAVEDRKTRIAAVNAKRGDRRQYAVDDLGNVSRGVTGREADPGKRVYKGAGTAIGQPTKSSQGKTKKPKLDPYKSSDLYDAKTEDWKQYVPEGTTWDEFVGNQELFLSALEKRRSKRKDIKEVADAGGANGVKGFKRVPGQRTISRMETSQELLARIQKDKNSEIKNLLSIVKAIKTEVGEGTSTVKRFEINLSKQLETYDAKINDLSQSLLSGKITADEFSRRYEQTITELNKTVHKIAKASLLRQQLKPPTKTASQSKADKAIDKTGFWLMDENFDRSRFPDFDMPDGAKNDLAIAKKFYSDLVKKYDPNNGGLPEQVANARKLYDQLSVLIELGGGDKKLSQSRKTEPQSSTPKLSVDPSKDKKGFWLMDENFDRSRFTDFDLPDNATRDAAVAKKVYLDLSRKYHPDAGGSDEQMANVRKLYDQMSALVEMNKPTKPSSKKPKYDNGLRIKDVSTSDTKTSSKSKLRPGAKFLAEAGLSPRIQERDGMKAIANALDTKTKLDTGSYEIGQRGSGSTHLGELDIIRLNKPSKQYPMGSASVVDSTGDRHVLDMDKLIDSVERQMLAKKVIAIGMPKDRIGRMDNTALKKTIEKESPVSDVDKAIAPLEELAKLRVDDSLESLFIDADRVGNKYQTPEEIRAQWKAESAVTQENADLIDKIPDDDDTTPTPTPVKPVAKVTTPPRKGSAYGGISDPLKKRISAPPPKKDDVGESPAKEKGDEYDFDALGNAHRHFITNTRHVGQSYKEGFESFMTELESKLKESTPQERQGEIPDILDASKQRYFRLLDSIKSTAEGAYSVMMAGGSKFNSKQAARRGSSYDKSLSNFTSGLRSIESDALRKTGAQDAIDAKESAKIIKKQQSEKEAKQILKEVQAKFKKTPIVNDPNYKTPKPITKAEWAKIPSDYKGVMIDPDTGIRYRAHMTKPVYLTDQKDIPSSKAEEAIAQLFTELEESGYRNPAKFIPSNFSEPSNIIQFPVRSHRQRLAKMREISRRYQR